MKMHNIVEIGMGLEISIENINNTVGNKYNAVENIIELIIIELNKDKNISLAEYVKYEADESNEVTVYFNISIYAEHYHAPSTWGYYGGEPEDNYYEYLIDEYDIEKILNNIKTAYKLKVNSFEERR